LSRESSKIKRYEVKEVVTEETDDDDVNDVDYEYNEA
jgi:hypothetical protein